MNTGRLFVESISAIPKAETAFLAFSRSVRSVAIPDFSSEQRPNILVDKADPDRMSTITLYKTSGILREQTIAVLLLICATLLVSPTAGWSQESGQTPTAPVDSTAIAQDGKPAPEDLLARSIEHTWLQ
ncbi:MAG: hypothetical protein GY826_06295, partial [Fuerstiella sp.]|nr:hypothetical protein [Fuerstiella sp.]